VWWKRQTERAVVELFVPCDDDGGYPLFQAPLSPQQCGPTRTLDPLGGDAPTTIAAVPQTKTLFLPDPAT
jgi:hypothetical protein